MLRRHRLRRVPLLVALMRTRRDLDPTRTITLRNIFSADMSKRFKDLRREVVESVATNDALALKTLQALPPRKFEFRTSSQKVEEFMAWLDEMIKLGILEVYYIPFSGRVGIWADRYIMSAYQRGLIQARMDAIALGLPLDPYDPNTLRSAMSSPFNVDRVALMYTRVYSDLAGVTDAMSSQMSRVLAQGIAEGINPNRMADRLVERIDSIGVVRARMIARTETIRAFNSAALMEFSSIESIIGKPVLVQWWTAEDERVCEVCAPRHAQIYTQDEVEKIMTPHPNCRCALLPYIEGSSIR